METATDHEKEEIATGLLADHAYISPKYFYDTVGSVLFEAICVLPEYYLTRVEADIFSRYQSEMAQVIRSGSTLIDLGAGNCEKATRLFSLIHPEQYVPIDISIHHLTAAARHLQQRFPHIEITALSKDLTMPWHLPDQIRRERRLFFYPGSSIGNFTPDAALAFLQRVRALCDEDGGILIGIDLIKEHSTLQAAYDDALGVTAAFNLNVLRHVNRLLGSNFDVGQWQHHAFFNEEQSRMEMVLEARTEVEVRWGNASRAFICGERIHTESSYKYELPTFLNLLQQSGFSRTRYWTDCKNGYAVIYAKAN